MKQRVLAVCLFAVAAAAGNLFAGAQARVSGVVTDAATKKPIAGVKVRVDATEAKTFTQTWTTDDKGFYQFMVLDGTIHYKMTFSAPGYAPYEEVMKFKIGGELNEKNVELQNGSAPAPAAAVGGGKVAAAPDKNLVAFNEGAKFFNEGNYDAAIGKFQDVVKAKPEMISAWEALAQSYVKKKEYAKAIDAAKKALDLAPDETDMWAVLYESYKATGDAAHAAEAKKNLPADASSLFNDAVKLLNAGKDAEAEPLLRKSIQANDKFGQAYFELGMVCIRTGKMAEAKTLLQKYLELEPNGKDAATAKESLKYLQ
jgi:tetratricopeptide (TPR) repeat protein